MRRLDRLINIIWMEQLTFRNCKTAVVAVAVVFETEEAKKIEKTTGRLT